MGITQCSLSSTSFFFLDVPAFEALSSLVDSCRFYTEGVMLLSMTDYFMFREISSFSLLLLDFL